MFQIKGCTHVTKKTVLPYCLQMEYNWIQVNVKKYVATAQRRQGHGTLPGLSRYPVSGILSGFYIIPVSGSEYSTSTGFKPGSWFSVCTVCIYGPLSCHLFVCDVFAVRSASHRQLQAGRSQWQAAHAHSSFNKIRLL